MTEDQSTDPTPVTAASKIAPDRRSSLPRILIVAENASARFGGEAILPLIYFSKLQGRGHEVHLITHERNRAELEERFQGTSAQISFTPDTLLHRFLWALGRYLPSTLRDHLIGNLMGLLTQGAQRRLAKTVIAQGKFDLVHQPIPVSPVAPSRLYGLDVPVIIGPMNGGMTYPPGYAHMEGRISRSFLQMGRATGWISNFLLPGKRRATHLLVANKRTANALPVAHPRVVEMVENGVDFDIFKPVKHTSLRGAPGLSLIFMGRLVALKAVDVTIDAIWHARAKLPDIPINLNIVGDGPTKEALKRQVVEKGLEELVTFHGFVPQQDCSALLRKADALILNSLRECGGAVVLEAMSQGLAVIASDWGGPADYLDESCGILVAPDPADSFADRLADAMVALATRPELVRDMGVRGSARVRAEFDWDRKIDRMLKIYDEAIEIGPNG